MTGVERVFKDVCVTPPDPDPATQPTPPDTDTRGRILATAIDLFGRGGVAATSVRSIAAEAGVSAPLVIHYFGGKDGLRRACDQQLIDYLDQLAGPVLRGEDPSEHLDADDVAALRSTAGYMITVIREGGEAAQDLYTKLTEQNLNALNEGVRAGTVRPAAADDAARAALTVAHSLAEHLLADLIAGYLGTTPRSPEMQARVGRESIELYTHGLFADERLLNLFLHGAARKQSRTTHPGSPNSPDPEPPARDATVRPPAGNGAAASRTH